MSDNSSLRFKVFQRQEVARALVGEERAPLILESFAGFGVVFGRSWREVDGAPLKAAGAAIEKDRDKARHLAKQRRDWIVARGDNASLIANGFCQWMPFNVLDADAYGSPWDVVIAFLESDRQRAETLYLLATDGLGYKLQLSGDVKVLAPLVERYGEKTVRTYYNNMVRELLEMQIERINVKTGSRFALLDFRFHDGGRLNHWTAKIKCGDPSHSAARPE